MKKLYCVSSRTKAEYAAGTPGATIVPAHFSSAPAAKTQAKANLAGATVSYVDIYGPSGIVFKGRNPAGA